MGKKSDNLRQKVFESYSTSVLEHEKEPKSVYLFCKELKIEEADFYKHFSSLEHVKTQIFCVILFKVNFRGSVGDVANAN